MICRYKIKFISDIEQKIRKLLVNIAVAPFVGVWIEIFFIRQRLKPEKASLPSWECGLKYRRVSVACQRKKSLPSWECGLKLNGMTVYRVLQMSLPSWECGLKYEYAIESDHIHCRSLRGSVD